MNIPFYMYFKCKPDVPHNINIISISILRYVSIDQTKIKLILKYIVYIKASRYTSNYHDSHSNDDKRFTEQYWRNSREEYQFINDRHHNHNQYHNNHNDGYNQEWIDNDEYFEGSNPNKNYRGNTGAYGSYSGRGRGNNFNRGGTYNRNHDNQRRGGYSGYGGGDW